MKEEDIFVNDYTSPFTQDEVEARELELDRRYFWQATGRSLLPAETVAP